MTDQLLADGPCLGGLLSPFILSICLMVCHGQYNILLREESFRWLGNAAGPLDVPLKFEFCKGH